MEIREVREKRKELECKILKLLEDFETATELNVMSLHLSHRHAPVGIERSTVLEKVIVELGI